MLSRLALVPALGLLLSSSLAAVACSSEADPAPPAPPPPAAETPSAPVEETPPAPAPAPALPKPSFPHVLSRGGPVVANPRVVPIVFQDDPLATQIDSFTQKLSTSAYWAGVAKEYGVGAITAAPMITIPEAAPVNITSSQVEAWLKDKLGATPAFGAPDASTLYAIYYPAGTTITMEDAGELGQSCQGYGGYHFEVDVGGKSVGYAVMPRCSGIDELTVAGSHEYFEWATDPFPQSKPAYNKLDDAHWAWQAVMIGELSDLCTFMDQDYLRPTELGFEVQRHWSNTLSLAGAFPCAPAKDVAYTQMIPFPEDEVIVPDYGQYNKYVHTKAVRVAPTKSRTVDVTVYSDKPTSKPLPLHVMSYSDWYKTGESSGFSFSLDTKYAQPGDVVKLTIEAPKTVGYDIAVLMTYTSDHSAHFWPLLVTNDDGTGVKAGEPTITPGMLPKKGHAVRDGASRVPMTKLGTALGARALRAR